MFLLHYFYWLYYVKKITFLMKEIFSCKIVVLKGEFFFISVMLYWVLLSEQENCCILVWFGPANAYSWERSIPLWAVLNTLIWCLQYIGKTESQLCMWQNQVKIGHCWVVLGKPHSQPNLPKLMTFSQQVSGACMDCKSDRKAAGSVCQPQIWKNSHCFWGLLWVWYSQILPLFYPVLKF